MRVEILVSMAGPRHVYQPGSTVEVDDDEAGRMIAKGYAVKAASKRGRQVETAVDR